MTIGIPHKAITDGPSVNWRHIDGALLSWAGHLHWLTFHQKWAIRLGLSTVDETARKQWPHLAKLRAALEPKT